MNLDRIEELIRLVKESTASELALESGGYKLVVRKQATPTPAVSAGVQAAKSASAAVALPAPAEPQPMVISAPMVGIFRHLRAPLEAGAPVEVGQAVGSIEVMKLANEVVSDCDGLVLKLLVEDGQPVEYGHPLFELVPAQAMNALAGGKEL